MRRLPIPRTRATSPAAFRNDRAPSRTFCAPRADCRASTAVVQLRRGADKFVRTRCPAVVTSPERYSQPAKHTIRYGLLPCERGDARRALAPSNRCAARRSPVGDPLRGASRLSCFCEHEDRLHRAPRALAEHHWCGRHRCPPPPRSHRLKSASGLVLAHRADQPASASASFCAIERRLQGGFRYISTRLAS